MQQLQLLKNKLEALQKASMLQKPQLAESAIQTAFICVEELHRLYQEQQSQIERLEMRVIEGAKNG